MSQNISLKTSVSEIICPVKKETIQDNAFDTNYKVFRNDTTSVEVIVKQVNNKKVKPTNYLEEIKVTTLCQDVEYLRNELNRANKNLGEAKKGFKLILFEMGKQLEAANQRELEVQTQNLVLQLEQEKLSSLLESKTNLVAKLRKELLGMRRIIKFVNKGIRSIPHDHVSEGLSPKSDSEYTAFVNNFKKMSKQSEISVKHVTNETTLSSNY